MICCNCKKTVHTALYEGRCKSCFDHLKQQPLELPRTKPKGVLTKKGIKINRRGKYLVRFADGMYLHTNRKPNRVEFKFAKVYTMLFTAKKAAQREGGKVIDLNKFSGEYQG